MVQTGPFEITILDSNDTPLPEYPTITPTLLYLLKPPPTSPQTFTINIAPIDPTILTERFVRNGHRFAFFLDGIEDEMTYCFTKRDIKYEQYDKRIDTLQTSKVDVGRRSEEDRFTKLIRGEELVFRDFEDEDMEDTSGRLGSIVVEVTMPEKRYHQVPETYIEEVKEEVVAGSEGERNEIPDSQATTSEADIEEKETKYTVRTHENRFTTLDALFYYEPVVTKIEFMYGDIKTLQDLGIIDSDTPTPKPEESENGTEVITIFSSDPTRQETTETVIILDSDDDFDQGGSPEPRESECGSVSKETRDSYDASSENTSTENTSTENSNTENSGVENSSRENSSTEDLNTDDTSADDSASQGEKSEKSSQAERRSEPDSDETEDEEHPEFRLPASKLAIVSISGRTVDKILESTPELRGSSEREQNSHETNAQGEARQELHSNGSLANDDNNKTQETDRTIANGIGAHEETPVSPKSNEHSQEGSKEDSSKTTKDSDSSEVSSSNYKETEEDAEARIRSNTEISSDVELTDMERWAKRKRAASDQLEGDEEPNPKRLAVCQETDGPN